MLIANFLAQKHHNQKFLHKSSISASFNLIDAEIQAFMWSLIIINQ